MSDIAMEIQGQNKIPCRILASKQSSNKWYIRVGTEEVFFFFFFFFFCLISHYNLLAAKANPDSAVKHVRLRHNQSYQLFDIITIFTTSTRFPGVSLNLCCFVVYSTRRFVV